MFLKYADNSYADEIFYSIDNNVVKRVINYITAPSKNYMAYTGCVGFPVYDIDMFGGIFIPPRYCMAGVRVISCFIL